jgi:protein disulfide-isomerase
MCLYKISLILLVGLFTAHADEKSASLWSADYSATLKKSKISGKPALVYFSGSNWCGFCKRLNSEILSTEKFKMFAQENFELVNLDFPHPAPENDRTYDLNVWLKEQHGVIGFPTILILDGDGVVLNKTGYTRSGPQALVDALTKIKSAK